jgi:hypothetical protein
MFARYREFNCKVHYQRIEPVDTPHRASGSWGTSRVHHSVCLRLLQLLFQKRFVSVIFLRTKQLRIVTCKKGRVVIDLPNSITISQYDFSTDLLVAFSYSFNDNFRPEACLHIFIFLTYTQNCSHRQCCLFRCNEHRWDKGRVVWSVQGN